jgi:HEAT repeat protein
MIETGDLGEIKRVKVELKGVSDYSPDSEYFREIAEKFLRYAGVEVVDEGYDAVLRVDITLEIYEDDEEVSGKISFISDVVRFSAQFRSETFITAMTKLILKIFGIQPLKKVLKRESRELRAGVAEALGEIGDARAVDALIEALRDEDSDVRRSVAWALDVIGWKPGNNEERVLYYIAKRDWGRCVKIGSFAVEFLIERLKDKDSDVRRSVAEALGKIGDSRAVDALIEALKDEDSNVRENVAEALGEIGDARAVDALIEALRDEDSDVRIRVAEALGEIGDARAVEALIEALKDEDSYVRKNSIDVLVEIAKKDLGVVDKLINALKDEDSNVRENVAWALGEIGDSRAVEALIEALKDEDSDVRESVAWALGAIGDARAVDSLIKTLKDDDNFVRESARKALVKILKILGVDFEYDYEKWERWWKENEGKFLK